MKRPVYIQTHKLYGQVTGVCCPSDFDTGEERQEYSTDSPV